MAVVALSGLVAGARSRLWCNPRAVAFWLSGTVVFAGMLPVFYNPRFMLPLLIWWAAAAGGFLQHFAGKKLSARAGVLIFVALVGWNSLTVVRESQDPLHVSSPAEELVDLARVARQEGLVFGPNTPIAARKPHIGYCLDAPVIPIPSGGVAELRAAGAHYLLVSAIEVRTYPLLAPLLQITAPSQAPPGLRLAAASLQTLNGGMTRGGVLYAVEDPLPWAPPRRESPVVAPDTEPGLDRLDTLRLRLARWHLLWNPDPSVESLIRLMSPDARRHPSVLVVEGDAALHRQDAASALSCYRRALPGPESSTTFLRLAGARLLDDPRLSARDLLNHPAAGLEKFRGDSTASWWTVAAPHFTGGNYAAAVAPLMACVEAAPDNGPCLRYLGISLMALSWHEEAASAFRRCLELDPEDVTARDALRAVEARLARADP